MKIVAIVGSMRNGNTKYLVDKALESVNLFKSVEVQKVHLRDLTMEYCDGCLICDETKRCVKKDDMTELVDSIAESDGFIFATPARWSLLSGEMKTFFDRLNPLAMTEELSGKKAIIIAVGQSEEDDRESIVSAADSVEAFCDNAGIEIVDKVIVCGCYNETDAKGKQNYIEQCTNATIGLLKALE